MSVHITLRRAHGDDVLSRLVAMAPVMAAAALAVKASTPPLPRSGTAGDCRGRFDGPASGHSYSPPRSSCASGSSGMSRSGRPMVCVQAGEGKEGGGEEGRRKEWWTRCIKVINQKHESTVTCRQCGNASGSGGHDDVPSRACRHAVDSVTAVAAAADDTCPVYRKSAR